MWRRPMQTKASSVLAARTGVSVSTRKRVKYALSISPTPMKNSRWDAPGAASVAVHRNIVRWVQIDALVSEQRLNSRSRRGHRDDFMPRLKGPLSRYHFLSHFLPAHEAHTRGFLRTFTEVVTAPSAPVGNTRDICSGLNIDDRLTVCMNVQIVGPKTLRITPAMIATGVTDRLWEIGDNVKILKDWEEANSVDLRRSWAVNPQLVMVGMSLDQS
jgi:hypothetical protein